MSTPPDNNHLYMFGFFFPQTVVGGSSSRSWEERREWDETELCRHPECFHIGGASESGAQLCGRTRVPHPCNHTVCVCVCDGSGFNVPQLWRNLEYTYINWKNVKYTVCLMFNRGGNPYIYWQSKSITRVRGKVWTQHTTLTKIQEAPQIHFNQLCINKWLFKCRV